MRRRLKPIVVLVLFSLLALLTSIGAVQSKNVNKKALAQADNTRQSILKTAKSSSSTSKSSDSGPIELKPIIDVSGWQLPSEIDYDTLSQNISGAIVRVYGGSQISKSNAAAHTSGLDKAYQTHLKEFKKRNVPVAVYAYAHGTSEAEMREEARDFYKASAAFEPVYYWVDIEEKSMTNMNRGVEAFRDELKKLGAKKVGIYIGTYFMDEHQISVEDFDAVWIPAYGNNTGYYDAAPQTDIDYHLHQYTDRGWVNGFSNHLDLNQIAPTQNTRKTYEELFGKLPE